MTRILVVDDDPSVRRLLDEVLKLEGYECVPAADAEEARARLAEDTFELALLDIMMPGESGIELLADVRTKYPEVAVVMVTGVDNPQLAKMAIETGASGYVVKPFAPNEMVITVANALHRRKLELAHLEGLRKLQAELEERKRAIDEVTVLLDQATGAVSSFREDTVLRLARTVELRDEGTGKHLRRMSLMSELIAGRLELSEEQCEAIGVASILHDVGKIAIPDDILLKPGKLTSEEYDIVKRHTHIGYELLQGSQSEVLQLGADIALSHHEWWDGNGYPLGYTGGGIPLCGRIAAVADVFDALTSSRPYRPAFSVSTAVEMMQDERGTHFDPEILDVLISDLESPVHIVHQYA